MEDIKEAIICLGIAFIVFIILFSVIYFTTDGFAVIAYVCMFNTVLKVSNKISKWLVKK